jgi:glycosyltransferase involved in cell wall biosynthesis
MKIHVALEKASEGRPSSIQLYLTFVRAGLEAQGVTFTEGAYDAPAAPDADLVWAPGMGNRRVPRALFAEGRPTVATIHGLQHISDPPMIRTLGLRKGISLYLWLRRIRRDWYRLRHRITTVIAVSETLKGQITTRLHIPADRIHVIPHGVPESFFAGPGGLATERGEYLLHVSQYSAVKNIPRMLAAYDLVRDRIGLPFKIIAAGYPPGSLTLPPGVELITTPVPHDQVRALMARAQAFIFPSTEESFGLPVLEAMASGVPVVTSEGTGAGEVAGNAALTVNPLDVAAIAGAMLKAATDEPLRARLRRDGLARAREYSWGRTAKAHLALFQGLLAGKGGR